MAIWNAVQQSSTLFCALFVRHEFIMKHFEFCTVTIKLRTLCGVACIASLIFNLTVCVYKAAVPKAIKWDRPISCDLVIFTTSHFLRQKEADVLICHIVESWTWGSQREVTKRETRRIRNAERSAYQGVFFFLSFFRSFILSHYIFFL